MAYPAFAIVMGGLAFFWVAMLGLLWRRSLIGMLVGVLFGWLSAVVVGVGWMAARSSETTPGEGAVLLVVFALGVVARHLLRPELVRAWERLLARVPLVGNVYASMKQLFEAFFQSGDTSRFNRVVLIEYPRKGLFALAFTTGDATGPVAEALETGAFVNCFVPTTPNPTSGFYLLVHREEVREVDITVEEAFKVIMSAGIVTPEAASLATPSVPPELVARAVGDDIQVLGRHLEQAEPTVAGAIHRRGRQAAPHRLLRRPGGRRARRQRCQPLDRR